MKLSQEQLDATEEFKKFLVSADKNEFVLEGYSGTGKSFLIKHLIQSARNLTNMLNTLTNTSGTLNVACTATTNKAAVVLSETSGEHASTIHSYLKFKLINNYSTGEKTLKKDRDYKVKKNTLVFIDEAGGMNDAVLAMVRESVEYCKVVFIGDPDQLIGVNAKVASAFIAPQSIGRLTVPQRFGKNNQICDLGHEFRKAVHTGIFPKIVPDGVVIRKVYGDEFQAMMDAEYADADSKPMNHAKVLAWKNDMVVAYNKYCRALSHSTDYYTTGEILFANSIVTKGDTLVLHNEDYACVTKADNTFSTEYGIKCQWLEIGQNDVCVAMDPAVLKARLKALAKAKEWHDFFAMEAFFADLRPAHASTVHKSQGSTYKKVFIDLVNIGENHVSHEVARMMYVAITRASEEVILYGDLPYKYAG